MGLHRIGFAHGVVTATGVDTAQHHPLAAGEMGQLDRRVHRIAHLHQQGRARLIADIDSGPVDGEVAKEEHITGLGGTGDGGFDGVLAKGEMPATFRQMF